MAIINNDRNVLAIILSFSVLLISSVLLAPVPSFADDDRIVTIRQGTTLAVACDLLSNGDHFIDTAKVLNYDQPNKSVFNCERTGGEGDIDLKKGESITLRCLHDNPLTIPKYVKMKAGELFYVLCNGKGFGKSSIGRDQGNFMITPLQKLAGMCDLGDTHVNTTESIICDKPVEVSGKEEPTNMTMEATEGSSDIW
jgi:hypothetical protein